MASPTTATPGSISVGATTSEIHDVTTCLLARLQSTSRAERYYLLCGGQFDGARPHKRGVHRLQSECSVRPVVFLTFHSGKGLKPIVYLAQMKDKTGNKGLQPLASAAAQNSFGISPISLNLGASRCRWIK